MEKILEREGNEMRLLRILEKVIILFLIFIIALIIKDYLLPGPNNYTFNRTIIIRKPVSVLNNEHYDMTATAYTRHPDCISPDLDDGITATNTKVREGVVAINVDLINGKWIVNSVLKLGQRVYITTVEDKPIGYFRVEDTGPFKIQDIKGASRKDLNWDRRNVDIYVRDINTARNLGLRDVKVYPLD
jgi:3D (Asp-Asp-Asp) domain-containing protein